MKKDLRQGNVYNKDQMGSISFVMSEKKYAILNTIIVLGYDFRHYYYLFISIDYQ